MLSTSHHYAAKILVKDMLLQIQSTVSSPPPLQNHHPRHSSSGSRNWRPCRLALQGDETYSSEMETTPLSQVSTCLNVAIYTQVTTQHCSAPTSATSVTDRGLDVSESPILQIFGREVAIKPLSSRNLKGFLTNTLTFEDITNAKRPLIAVSAFSCGVASWLTSIQVAHSSEDVKMNVVYEVGEYFELGIQLSYLLLLLGLIGVGTFFVIRQVLVRRELDLSAKELQEQVRSGDASATELFELGAVMLRRKFYPAATKFLLQAIEKWDGDDQDLAQVYNALGVSYVRDEKLEKGIAQFEKAVKLQPGYVIAWNNLGDAYERKKDLQSALKAFEEALLFDPNNKVARPRRDALKDRVQLYKGIVPTKPKER